MSVRIGGASVNAFVEGDRSLVSKVESTRDLKSDVLHSVDLIGGFSKAIEKGDEVWLKPNFNTSDAPPGSSDPEFVKAVVELLFEHGAGKVVIGESSMLRTSTRAVFEETGMLELAKEACADVVFFDEGRWIKTSVGGKNLGSVSLPERALNARKLVYVCCMKTHRWAKFTLSLKLAVGFMKPSERMLLHARHLEEKIADLNLVVNPDLIIMDGRNCFISGGPACGELRNPNVVLASGDRIALDVEAVKLMRSFEGSSLEDDPWDYAQIRRAAALRLGARSSQDYVVVP